MSSPKSVDTAAVREKAAMATREWQRGVCDAGALIVRDDVPAILDALDVARAEADQLRGENTKLRAEIEECHESYADVCRLFGRAAEEADRLRGELAEVREKARAYVANVKPYAVWHGPTVPPHLESHRQSDCPEGLCAGCQIDDEMHAAEVALSAVLDATPGARVTADDWRTLAEAQAAALDSEKTIAELRAAVAAPPYWREAIAVADYQLRNSVMRCECDECGVAIVANSDHANGCTVGVYRGAKGEAGKVGNDGH